MLLKHAHRKTLTSLAIMLAYQRVEWPLLILCPASLRYTWPSEIEKFCPWIPSQSIHVVRGKDDVHFAAQIHRWRDQRLPSAAGQETPPRCPIQIVIVTYSLLQTRFQVAEVLRECTFECVIADESHNLKQRSSQRCELALPLLRSARRLLLLSGTPALNRPVELWPQLNALDPKGKMFGEGGMSYTKYTQTYCNAKRTRFGWDVKGVSNAADLHRCLKLVMVRRLKSDVLHDLPSKQRSIVAVTISDKQKERESREMIERLDAAKHAMEEISDFDADDVASAAQLEARKLLMQGTCPRKRRMPRACCCGQPILTPEIWHTEHTSAAAYQASGVAKAPATTEYILDWLEGSVEKLVVFAHHKDVLDYIETTVNKKHKGKLGIIRIDGQVPPAERALRVKKFQTDRRVRLAVLSMTAAGVGLTLTAASNIIFAELHWTPGVLAQAEDRCHRIGQRSAVNVVYCICNDREVSVDTSLWGMLVRKVGNLGRVVDGERVRLNAVQKEAGASVNGGKGNVSVEEELSSFFASSTVSGAKQSKGAVVKGTIQSFFNKQAKKSQPTKTLSLPNQEEKPKSNKTACISLANDENIEDVVSEEKMLPGQIPLTFAFNEKAKKKQPAKTPAPSAKEQTSTSSKSAFISLLDDDDIGHVKDAAARRKKPPGQVSLISIFNKQTKKSQSTTTSSLLSKETSQKSSKAASISLLDCDIEDVAVKEKPGQLSLIHTDTTSPAAQTGRDEQPIGQEWKCRACTYINQGRNAHCEMCNTQQEENDDQPIGQEWKCRACTYINQKRNARCEMCNMQREENVGWAVHESRGADFEDRESDHADINYAGHKQTAKCVVSDECEFNDGEEWNEEDLEAIDRLTQSHIIVSMSPDTTTQLASPGVVQKDCVPHESTPKSQPCPSDIDQTLSFSVSLNSGRIALHQSSSGKPLHINFDISQVMTKESAEVLDESNLQRKMSTSPALQPAINYDDGAVKQILAALEGNPNLPPTPSFRETLLSMCEELKQFVTCYLSLREVEKKAVKESGQPIASRSLKQTVAKLLISTVTGSTERYQGGAKEKAIEALRNNAATAEDMAVINGQACAWCAKPFSSNNVIATYCSHKCAEEGRVRRGGIYSSTRVRQSLFALERGVCAICNLDAHSFFCKITALHPAERLNALLSAKWKLPKTRQAIDRLLSDPKEPDFWQADHELAVAEGGGSTGLDNLRTLCTPCHGNETEKLIARLKTKPDQGVKDGLTQMNIISCFSQTEGDDNTKTKKPRQLADVKEKSPASPQPEAGSQSNKCVKDEHTQKNIASCFSLMKSDSCIKMKRKKKQNVMRVDYSEQSRGESSPLSCSEQLSSDEEPDTIPMVWQQRKKAASLPLSPCANIRRKTAKEGDRKMQRKTPMPGGDTWSSRKKSPETGMLVECPSLLTHHDKWKRRYRDLAAFQEEHGHCNVPQKGHLGTWVSNQRASRRNGTLAEKQVAQLAELGFTWELGRRKRRRRLAD